MDAPRYSVIVPTHGRPDRLRECLEALFALEPPSGGFEAVVVDDGSPVSNESVVQELAANGRIRLIRQERRGPGSARNAGARVAHGRLLVFLDDDCVPQPDWLIVLDRQFERTPQALIGGRIENGLPNNPYSAASQLITSYTYEYYDRMAAAERFFTTNNFAVAAAGFDELGGFDERIPAATAEDKEFCDRWRAAGRPLVHAAEAVVHHRHHLTLRGYLRQHYNYGRGILCFRVMRARGSRPRLRPEPVSFYLDLVLYPLRRASGWRAWRDVALLLLAQAATLVGAVHGASFDLRRLPRTRGRAVQIVDR